MYINLTFENVYHVEYVANKDSQSQAARGVMVRISLCAFLQSKTLDILFILIHLMRGMEKL